jgi:hypothetical protein
MSTLLAKSDEWGVTTILSIKLLYPCVDIDYYINKLPHKKEYNINYQAVLKSVEQDGMKNPIVVAPVTKEEWDGMIHPTSELDIFRYPDVSSEQVYQVRCGCKRLHMAKNLGFTHIECVLLKNFKESTELCVKIGSNKKKELHSRWSIL